MIKQALVLILTLSLMVPFAMAEEEQKPPKDLGSMTLIATPVEKPPTPKVAAKTEKKPIPVYLQPFEFIFSSVVHAITFWKTGDELN